MGNKTSQVLPTVITKNWYPLSLDGDIYHNKLTDEFVRKHIVKVSNSDKLKLNALKTRLKQNNPYICRVAFYYHLVEDVYNVYTDETRNKPKIVYLQQWRIHKQNIIDSFISLSQTYGPMRVCREMIGVDLKGQIKVWINPDTVAWQRWCPCKTQTQMIADILAIFRLFEEQSNRFKNKAFIRYQKKLFNKTLVQNQASTHKNDNEPKQKHQDQIIYQLRQIPIKKTSIFKPTLQKKNSQQISDDKNGYFKKSLKINKHIYTKSQIKQKNDWTQYRINKKPIQKNDWTQYRINKKPIQKIKQTQQNPYIQQINQQILHKQNIKRINRSQNNKSKNFTNQKSIDFLKNHFFKSKELFPTIKKQNLTNKQMNLAEIIVKKQREFRYTDMLHENPKQQLKKQIQMTMSQQLWNFFDDLQGKEYQQAQQMIRKKSFFYEEIKDQIDVLFN